MLSKTDLDNALAQLGMCKSFPRESATQAAIMELLARMCPHKQALEWLVDTMVNKVGEWHGPAELRGVLCSRFKPANGIETDCASTPNFTPDAQEMRSIEAHYDRKRLESPRVTRLLAGEVEVPAEESVRLQEFGVEPQRKIRCEDLRAVREFNERIASTQFAADEFEPLPKPHIPSRPLTEDDRKHLAGEPWFQEYQRIRGCMKGLRDEFEKLA